MTTCADAQATLHAVVGWLDDLSESPATGSVWDNARKSTRDPDQACSQAPPRLLGQRDNAQAGSEKEAAPAPTSAEPMETESPDDPVSPRSTS